MGIIQTGILGSVSGKVAGVVGGRWKDKAYLRAYTIPANPNTAAQQTQRTKFSDTVEFAKPLVGQIFNAYTDKFQKAMSGFNFFIKRNIAVFDGSPDLSLVKIAEGPLSPVNPSLAELDGTEVTISYASSLGNNGLETDAVFAIVYNDVSGVFSFAAAEVARSVHSIVVDVGGGAGASNLHAYVLTAQYVSTVLSIIANSVYEEVVAA